MAKVSEHEDGLVQIAQSKEQRARGTILKRLTSTRNPRMREKRMKKHLKKSQLQVFKFDER